MKQKILFVDDESAVLEGYRRTLRDDFQPQTATSGEQAIAEIIGNGPYAVVVSDMRMAGMNGLELLARVREISPPTIRVILTGFAEIQTAMAAVNEDEVFRFLTKPCSDGILKKTLNSCLLQYQLHTAEKELLENTLMGSIKVLTDVLSLADPAAFGRSLRVNHYVQHMVRALRLETPWKYEAAAMLSQLGCITLEPEVLETAYRGQQLNVEEAARFRLHPAVGRNLLANIPRLEGIAWIVGQQFADAGPGEDVPESMKRGAMMLRIAIAFDELKVQGRSDQEAIAELSACPKFDALMVQALTTLPKAAAVESRIVDISDIEPGMVLEEEVRSTHGLLLAGKGQEVTYPLVVRLRNFHRRRAIPDKATVLVASESIPKKRWPVGAL